MAEYAYKIASTWDNEAGFTNIEELTPANGNTLPGMTAYFFVKAAKRYLRGQRRFSPDGSDSHAGLKRVVWEMQYPDLESYDWFVTNYEGQATIATTTGKPGTYTNYNVYVECPDPEQLPEITPGRFGIVEVVMKLVETT